MSRTYKHKDKGKYNNGVLDKIPADLQNMWDRSNNEWGEFRKAKRDLIDKIAKKELKQQIKTDEYNFKLNGEFIEDIDDPYYTSRNE
jgi:hypothetical protein